jgi:arsenate reductase
VIKRPVLQTATACHVGFKPDQYRQIFTE